MFALAIARLFFAEAMILEPFRFDLSIFLFKRKNDVLF
jgi:hypothetical protein